MMHGVKNIKLPLICVYRTTLSFTVCKNSRYQYSFQVFPLTTTLINYRPSVFYFHELHSASSVISFPVSSLIHAFSDAVNCV
jgi:hypothetical protein